MIKAISVRRHIIGIILLLLCVFLANPSSIMAQKRTHVVVKGDTLWDLCEKYYGDSELWPKLWEMNPFITNPHLLRPGDVITLLEGVPFRKEPTSKGPMLEKPRTAAAYKSGKKMGGPLPEATGIDLSSLVNVKDLGFLSPKKVKPWGYIVASDSHKLILSPGDLLFLVFDEDKKIRPGDEFTIARSSEVRKHPITGKTLGYIISFNGRLVIERQTGVVVQGGKPVEKKNAFEAKILDMFRTVEVGNMLIPYEPHPSCIRPVPVKGEVVDNIVAARDDLTVLSEQSIVYLDRGFNQGIRPGNLFEVVNTTVFPDKSQKTQSNAGLPKSAPIVFPDTRLGTLLILDARADTSTGIILTASEIFPLGTYIKGGFKSLEETEALSLLPTCPSE